MAARIWAVVPAGGVGARMNSDVPKQYLALSGRPMIEHTLDRLCGLAAIDFLVVGVAAQDPHWRALAYHNSKLSSVVSAGKERVDTVRNCLKYIVDCGGKDDWALVHDAARPCVRTPEIQNLIDTVLQAGQGGILAVALSDTVKRSVSDTDKVAACKAGSSEAGSSELESSEARILETVPRDRLWRAMTPQLFKVGELLSAIDYAQSRGISLTDEASALEATGGQPLLLPCSPDNIKITLPQDIALAQLILAAQETD